MLKGKKKYMNKLKGSILINEKKVVKILAMQAMMLLAALPEPPVLLSVLSQDLVILIYLV